MNWNGITISNWYIIHYCYIWWVLKQMLDIFSALFTKYFQNQEIQVPLFLYVINVQLFSLPPWAWPGHGRCSWWCRWGWCPSCLPAGNPCVTWAWARRQPAARWWSGGSPVSGWPAPSPCFCRSQCAQTPRSAHNHRHGARQLNRSDFLCD